MASPMRILIVASLLARCASLRAYGHAYQAPGDFTPSQYATIASRYPIFTIEKRHAWGVYGNASAPPGSPARHNSIAATVGTARKIKALNSSTRVLMYWNSALNFNLYECEAEVQPPPRLSSGSFPP